MSQNPDADDIPGPDPVAVHTRSVAVIRAMDAGDIQAVGGLLAELGGPEEFGAQVVSLASLASFETWPSESKARTSRGTRLSSIAAQTNGLTGATKVACNACRKAKTKVSQAIKMTCPAKLWPF